VQSELVMKPFSESETIDESVHFFELSNRIDRNQSPPLQALVTSE